MVILEVKLQPLSLSPKKNKTGRCLCQHCRLRLPLQVALRLAESLARWGGGGVGAHTLEAQDARMGYYYPIAPLKKAL